MSYAATWRLNTNLATPVREYVDTLLSDSTISFLSWQRSGRRYKESARLVTSLFGSMLSDGGLELTFPSDLSPEEISEGIVALMRPDSQLRSVRRLYRDVEAGHRAKKRTFSCFLNVHYGRAMGHALLLFVDYRSKTQVFFDGHGRTSRWGAFCEIEPLVTGFRVVPETEALDFDGLQGHLERWLDADQTGTCGLTTMMVLLVARRFNFWHLPGVANALREAYPSDVDAGVMMQAFVSHYEETLLRLNPAADLVLSHEQKQKLFEQLFPPMGKCLVYSERSGKLCSRKACKNGPVQAHCWQHRHIMQSPYRRSKKCSARF